MAEDRKCTPAIADHPAGEALWRSPEDLAGEEQARRFLEGEFPEPAAPEAVDRRGLLGRMAASLALAGLGGCAVNRQPWGAPLLSHPRLPPLHTPGVPLRFATSLELDGLGRGMLVESTDGRPVKIEGNPLHPASLGGTDAFAQAEVLSLYDPDRSDAPSASGARMSWADAWRVVNDLGQQARSSGGAGLYVLLEPRASPTVDRLVARARLLLPEARWFTHAPLATGTAHAASRTVFGRPLDQVLDLTAADVIVTLGGDLLCSGAAAIRYAADFAQRRRAPDRPLPRLYAAESTPSLTGARADLRLMAPPRTVEAAARQILAFLRGPTATTGQLAFAQAAAADLRRAGARGVVAAGREQPRDVQAIANAINGELGAAGVTMRYIEPVIALEDPPMGSLASLAEAIAAGRVRALLILGGNPAYDAPGDLDFSNLLSRVPMSMHIGTYQDETAILCRWHLPARHALESWGDLRAFDGTAGLRQPATVPLIQATAIEELLARVIGEPGDAHALVQATWREDWGDRFEALWLKSLEDGVIAGSAYPPVAVAAPSGWRPGSAEAGGAPSGQTVVFAPDPSVWDGRFANNGWLQELPKPLTKQVWGNAALMAPATAAAFGLRTGDMALFTHGGLSVEAPVWLLPGHAPDVTTMTLGFGRRAAGRIGSRRGFDAYQLRSSEQPWAIEGVTIIATGRRQELVSTQHHHSMEGRDIVRVAAAAAPPPPHEPETRLPSMYPEYVYDGNAWGMAIDLDLCLGCNACVIACQAENNVPIVGPDEVARGREMHWLRIDRYFAGPLAAPETYFQPVLCMHCEKAPCEVVCPVNATVHSSEGLNEMTYSRCVGTRTCSNNCPYKVRRFNWFNYGQRPFSAPDEVYNPEVTVRWRGVIEKCTYCVHRIGAARIAAGMENRPIRDGELMTACQQACPTRAIVFGNINDPGSAVADRKASPRNYALLGELNTRPRTTYLARLSQKPPLRRAGGGDDDTG
ncbi:MAG: TAT-variant-translocated molybdopterin oxidoreductase [Hyphomicrobiaceae bacterium]|nr:TAT-variant-translocated molybdopterin oxidoreductase [Hyphomicrobiaceae bacterium]